MNTFKIIAAIAIIILVAQLVLFWYNTTHLPRLPFIDQSDKTVGSGPVLRYIAAGDSTSVGEGASSFEKTYAYGIAEKLSEKNTVAYKNIGVRGYKTSDVLLKQVQTIIAFKPDVITISMGANDQTHLIPSSRILENYRNIISELEEKTSAQIYITDIPNFHGATILPWWFIQIIEFKSKGLNKQIMALADSRVTIINIHDFGWSQFSNMKSTYAADHFHPNDSGYKNWKDAFLESVKR